MDFSLLLPLQPVGIQSQGKKIETTAGSTQNLDSACQAFEALFASALLSEMANSIGGREKSGTAQMQEKWVWNMMFQTIARDLAAAGSFGVKEQVLQKMNNTQ